MKNRAWRHERSTYCGKASSSVGPIASYRNHAEPLRGRPIQRPIARSTYVHGQKNLHIRPRVRTSRAIVSSGLTTQSARLMYPASGRRSVSASFRAWLYVWVFSTAPMGYQKKMATVVASLRFNGEVWIYANGRGHDFRMKASCAPVPSGCACTCRILHVVLSLAPVET